MEFMVQFVKRRAFAHLFSVLGGMKEIIQYTSSVKNNPPVGFSAYYGNIIDGVDYGTLFSAVTQDADWNKRGVQLFVTYTGMGAYARHVLGSTLSSWKEL